ncbi:MAG: hypothetical protein AVDCRST_MAG86-1029, partial [uncultured Truepera sp.]
MIYHNYSWQQARGVIHLFAVEEVLNARGGELGGVGTSVLPRQASCRVTPRRLMDLDKAAHKA